MAHHIEVTEEKYIFGQKARRAVVLILIIGVVLFLLGIALAALSGSEGHSEGHGAVSGTENLMAAAGQEHGDAAKPAEHVEGQEHSDAAHPAEHAEGHGDHGSSPLIKRLFTSLWMNNIYFAGIGIIGLFFIAIQYAAQAGWSVGVKRVPLAIGAWMPFAGLLMLVLWFVTGHDIFHWTHSSLYHPGPDFDPIISGKSAFFFWPLEGGSFPIFFIVRMVVFFGLWYWFYRMIRKNMLTEDLNGGTELWKKNRSLSAVFLVFFGFSSSVAAWDWVMSIDTHWFSTMFGWYVFASWWVTGLAFITLIVAHLKSAGYLKIVNANHLHDLGKFVFAFSIFWTYIWFSQFLLIYYANIPEESVYFFERLDNAPYNWIFFVNLILNFVLPFLLLMTRDAKRQVSMLKVVTPIIIVGHWLDFYNMVTPGVMQKNGSLGLLEIGLALIFLAAFLFVVLNELTKFPLFGKNDPMLEESLHHHI